MSETKAREIMRLAGIEETPVKSMPKKKIVRPWETDESIKAADVLDIINELASSEKKFNSGGLPLAGRHFLTSSGQKIKVLSQDLKNVTYVNVGTGGKDSEEFLYPLQDFDAWIDREVTPTDNWPAAGVNVKGPKGEVKLDGKGKDFSAKEIADMRKELVDLGYSEEDVKEMDDQEVLGTWQAETGYVEPDEANEAAETKIGSHTVKFISSGTANYGGFGSNKTAEIEFDGKSYEALRQGGIGIWAFAKRTSLSSEEAKQFDKFMDDNA
jgi:hypothetical protein